MSMRSLLRKISGPKYDWSAEEISKTPRTRRMWKRTWKRQERRAMKGVEPDEISRD